MSNNLKDINKRRWVVVKDRANKDLIDLLTIDCFAIEILTILFFILFQIFKWTKFIGRPLKGSEILILLNEAVFPVFIFVGFTSIAGVIKIIRNYKRKVKESVRLYIITLSFNIIFTIIFFSTYFICRNALYK